MAPQWKPFYMRNELPWIVLVATWKCQYRTDTGTFKTYHYIGRLPEKYHKQLIDRFKNVFVYMRKGAFAKQNFEFIDCKIEPYKMLSGGSFIPNANEFVLENCRTFEDQDQLESKRE